MRGCCVDVVFGNFKVAVIYFYVVSDLGYYKRVLTELFFVVVFRKSCIKDTIQLQAKERNTVTCLKEEEIIANKESYNKTEANAYT